MNLVADIADDKRFAICRAAFFAMKAGGNGDVSPVRTERTTAVRALFPMPSPSLSAVWTCEGDGEFYGLFHAGNLTP